MDDDKIMTEKKYYLDGIYSTINNTDVGQILRTFKIKMKGRAIT